MKKLIRKLLENFGYEIRKVVEIEDAIAYNAASGVDTFYSDPAKVELYLKFEVQNILSNNMAEIQEKRIDLNGKKVLDVGCGTGHFLKAINASFPTAALKGTEFVESARRLASKTMPGVEIVALDIEKQCLSESFDFISCMQVLEHLKNPKEALQNLMKMLDAGGSLFLAVPDGRTDTFPGHIYFWGIDSWRLLLEESFPRYPIHVGYMADRQSLYAWVEKVEIKQQ